MYDNIPYMFDCWADLGTNLHLGTKVFHGLDNQHHRLNKKLFVT